MAERAQSLQDTFLNHVRKNKTPLTIFLVNGVKLQGIVTWFDNIRAHPAFRPTFYHGSLLSERFPHLREKATAPA